MLGAGGAARAAVWGLLREGAAVAVWNRTGERARELCRELGCEAAPDPDPAEYALIVNTSAAGLHGEDPFAELPLREDGFAAGQTVVDMVYGDAPRGCSPPPRRPARRRRRDRGAGPAGRPLARDLDRAPGPARDDARADMWI